MAIIHKKNALEKIHFISYSSLYDVRRMISETSSDRYKLIRKILQIKIIES